MELSQRLKAIAEQVTHSDLFVDIGTDHAYLPIYLFQNGIIKKAIAGDISKGSIQKAKNNIDSYGYSNVIDTRLGNGLKVINSDESPDTVVMSGMGGMLMIEILKNSIDIVKKLKKLILQPQRDIDKVRKYIHEIKFKIIYEQMIFSDNKYYNIIVCVCGKDSNYSECDYLFGKLLINKKNNILKEYIINQIYKVDKAIESIQANNTNKDIDRLRYLNNFKNNCKEALKCL